MKLTRVLGRSAFAFFFGYAIFGSVEVARAQSACGCPVGSFATEGGLCVAVVNDERVFFNPTCKTPQIGQIAASQQQLSFSTVAGVLRTRRDQLQGPLGSPSNPISPVMGYSTFNLDDSFAALGYASRADRPVYGAD